ncbi:MAG: hypothetical protein NW220_14355 [Leptolyngbyaceae cyanobacterium bins.349]|nr:hypothetical protein [Leptolyngbyaceae cyanobacterium bins.349]
MDEICEKLRGSILLRDYVISLLAGSLTLVATPAWAAPDLSASQTAQDLLPPENLPHLAIATHTPILPIDARSLQPDVSFGSETAIAQATEPTPAPTPDSPKRTTPDLLDTSPTFQRWNREIPNVLEDIRRDPAFRTRARLGLSYFPTTFDSLGWHVGVEDVFIGKTGLTVSGDYQATFSGARKAGGAELRYYILPLGGYFNIAPVLGYRYLETTRYITDGLNVGAKFQLVLSRTGATDIAFTQTWVNPRQGEEVGLTKFSFGYALTKNLRLSTDIEKQNSKQKKDTRFGISFEWMF